MMQCELPIEQHRYSLARIAVLRERGRVCARCGNTEKIQTHHIRPWFTFPDRPEKRPKKSSKDKGCWNHHDNLEVLCKTCHVALHMRRKFWSAKAWIRAVAG